MRYCFLALLLIVASCKKSSSDSQALSLIVTEQKDTFNFISLTIQDYIGFSDTSIYSAMTFAHDSLIGHAGKKGDTTFANYFQGGYLKIRYLGSDSLFLVDSVKTLNDYGVSYRLSKKLLGLPLFQVYSVLDKDTTIRATYYAAADSVLTYVGTGYYPVGATPTDITSAYNSLLYGKLDTTRFTTGKE